METTENTQAVAAADREDEISLLDLAIVLAKHKKAILGVPFLVAVIVAGISLLMTPIYTATTKILPPQQSQSAASAMLSQLGALAGGIAGSAGLKNPSDMYVGMIQSRTVADGLIKRFKLDEYYESELASSTRKTLADATNIKAGKDGIITIDVDDKDPKRAAELANAYVDELFKLTNTLAVTEASQRRLFFERQLKQAKDKLDQAELAARQAMSRGGVAKADAQGMAVIETTAQLRAQVSAKEVQISAMRAFAADRNPDLLRAQQELAAMQRELGKLEGGNGDAGIPNGVPARGAETLALLRDVKYAETLFELLAKQVELAKIDEAKDASIIQVMDPAIAPDRKSKPKRALIVVLSALAAGFAMVLWAFVKEGMDKARQNSESAERLATLSRYLVWRKR